MVFVKVWVVEYDRYVVVVGIIGISVVIVLDGGELIWIDFF